MQFDGLLKDLCARDPGGWIIDRVRVKAIPARWRLCRRQRTEEGQNPCGNGAAESLTDPVAFRISGAARVRLDEARALEAHRQCPDHFERGTVLHVEQFQNHCAADLERGEAS